jgi:surface protein
MIDEKASLKASDEKVSSKAIERTHAFFTHDWGEGRRNHLLISKINALIRELGIMTWFDEEWLTGDIQDEMAEGIENTLCMVVFITRRYHDKVNGKDAGDNCRFEFKHAVNHLKPYKMIPVVVDETMKDARAWKGALGGNLGSMLYIDMTDHDEASLAAKSIELYNRIVQVADLSLPTLSARSARSPRSASLSDANVPALLNEIEQLRRQVAEYEREIEQLKAVTIFSQSSGAKKNTNRRPSKDPGLVRTDDDIRSAVNLWCKDREAAELKYGHISQWDTSKVTNMKELFRYNKDFNDDISRWNVANVTTMYAMFYGASSFNQPLEQWNVSNVTNMYGMFCCASSFDQPIEQWDVSNVTNMYGMFCCASSFDQPIEQWDVSKVTTMNLMFKGASSFNQPLEQWNVSKVTTMWSMFQEASAFNQPLERWNVSKVTTMYAMFDGAASFNQPLRLWNLCKDIDRMFYNSGMSTSNMSYANKRARK